MSNFSNYKKFENVGIRSSNDTLIIMNSSNNNNISLHSSDGGDDNVDTLSIKNIINKTPNMDLNLSSLNENTINPVITINNNNSDCRIMTNLNVYGNVNINNNLIIPRHDKDSSLLSNTYGSIYYNTTENIYEAYSDKGWQPFGISKTEDATIHKNLNVSGNINLTNGEMIQTTGIGSFGSINCGVGTFTNLNISGNLNLPVGITSSRPSNPNPGTIRYNNETHEFEGYSGFGGGLWINLSRKSITFIELALLGGGGGGGDGNPQGGGGGGGALVQASGMFPINVPFILQLGGGGIGPSGDNSGSAGHMTQLTSNGFDLRAYGGGFGGSYLTVANTTFYDSTRNGGPGGGGAGPSPHTGSTSGATAGSLGAVTTNNIVTDLQTTFFGGNGGNFYTPGDHTKTYPGQGGHGGGAGGNAINTQWGSGDPRNPVGETSGSALWDSNLNWGRGGYGGPPAMYPDYHAGNSNANNLYNVGAGGAGSSDKSYGSNTSDSARWGQHGRIGAAIINVPAGISISITGSIPNMTTTTASVNGGTSYAFYDSRWYLTTGGPSGSFTISFTST